MTIDAAQAWYVYSVLPATGAAPAGDGVLPGAPVQAIRFDALTVLASLVPRALFESTNAANRTAEPEWMAARVAAHHAVNVAATDAGACLPLAFGSLFSSLDLLREWLEPNATSLLAALGRVAGRTEWVLTMQEDAAAHAAWLDDHDPGLQAMVAAVSAAGEGTAFLMARRLDKSRATARIAHIAAAGSTVAARLAATGLTVLPEPPAAGLPSLTVLASTAASDAMTEVQAALGRDFLAAGLGLRLSGPWPAYAFARAALLQEIVHG